MAFDSLSFWIFFACAWALWRLLPFGAAKTAMVLASLFFYGWWNPAYLLLILFSTAVDWFTGERIHRAGTTRGRRAWLGLSLVSNLGLLAFFKYGPFLARNALALGGADPATLGERFADWVVPVGISFYTFQTLSYSIDIYRGRLLPARSFRDFLLFVAFFPQLVAGPIVRASQLLPQLDRRSALRAPRVLDGLYRIVEGLFLKMVVADNLAPAVGSVFEASDLATLPPASAWLGTIFFGAQIWADFAGYSGIAIGLAHLLGLRFPENFHAPYLARGLSDFWRRWHVTLSTWLRDYLYIPLGGNRRGEARTYVNLLATMLLGGLWHGAAWTFVAWGAIHGLGLCLERRLRGTGERAGAVRGVAAWCVTYLWVHLAWVFFRAPSFAVAGTMLERLLVAPFREGLAVGEVTIGRHALFLLPLIGLHAARALRERGVRLRSPVPRAVLAGVLLFLLAIVERSGGVEFLYFQF